MQGHCDLEEDNTAAQSLAPRAIDLFNRSLVPNSFSHAFTCNSKHAGVVCVDPDGDPCPPYSIAYNQVVNNCKFLTIGDEEGCVSILDTAAEQLPASLYTDTECPPRAKWLAHNNTIFDLAWAKNDSVLFTASGDQHVGVWDTAAGRLLMYCAGHDGSVKAVCPHSSQPDIFASGSRDGVILLSSDMDGVVKLWDLRRLSQPASAFTLPAQPRLARRGSSRRGGGSAAAAGGGGNDDDDEEEDDEQGACWLGLSCPSRTSSRPAGITNISLNSAGKPGSAPVETA
eukprot:gene10257-10415_t